MRDFRSHISFGDWRVNPRKYLVSHCKNSDCSTTLHNVQCTDKNKIPKLKCSPIYLAYKVDNHIMSNILTC